MVDLRGFIGQLSSWFKLNYHTLALLLFIASFLLLPTSKMVNNVYYALVALPGLFALFRDRGRLLPLQGVEWGWLAFFVWVLGVGAISGDLQFFKHVGYVMLFLACVALLVRSELFRHPRFARALFWTLIAYVVLSALLYWVIGSYVVGQRVLWLPGRMTGPIYTSIWLASCLALVAPAWIRERRYIEGLSGLCLMLFCIGFILQSRSGLVGVAVLGVLLAGWYLARAGRPALLGVFAVSVLVAALLGLLIYDGHFESLLHRADAGRFELWSILLADWWRCGLLSGCGLDYETQALILGGSPIQHPHNIFLALGLYYGLPALLLFLTAMLLTLWRAWCCRDAWGLYLLVALCMLNFDGSSLIGNPDELWLLVLLPAALIINRYRNLSQRAQSA